MKIRIPATTANMGPGFDSFGMALQLYNEIEVHVSANGLQITADGTGSENVPLDEQNIVYQAIRYVYFKAGETVPPLRIHIHNEVPITRGLGSSATVIVGGVIAANQLLQNRFTRDELLVFATALEGHPDNVSAALLGGFVVSGQFGDDVFYKRFDLPNAFTCVVAVPNFQLSTSVSRNVLPAQIDFQKAVSNVSAASLMVAALATGDMNLLRHAIRDCLHEPYRMRLVPGMEQAALLAKQAGALGVALSGAGPSVIAFCEDSNTSSVQQALIEGLTGAGTTCKAFVLKPDAAGAVVLDERLMGISPEITSRNPYELSRME